MAGKDRNRASPDPVNLLRELVIDAIDHGGIISSW